MTNLIIGRQLADAGALGSIRNAVRAVAAYDTGLEIGFSIDQNARYRIRSGRLGDQSLRVPLGLSSISGAVREESQHEAVPKSKSSNALTFLRLNPGKFSNFDIPVSPRRR